MRDPAEIYTRRGTPLILIGSRLAFTGYFFFALYALRSAIFPHSTLEFSWIVYLAVIYGLVEYLHQLFHQKGIELTFAFPILFAIYCLNLTTILLGGQEQLPLLNRAEHFASFVLLSFVVWVFFIQYLPQAVWRDHPYYTALLVMSVTALAGVINELVELLLDQLFGSRLVGSSYDTSLDLLMNTLGSGLFLAVRLILGAKEKH